MEFELFATLYKEAKEYNDVDMFIAERAWQDWMDTYSAEELGDLLKRVYAFAHMNLREMREEVGYSRKKFCDLYGIPVRTVENWDSGARQMPSRDLLLIAYTFFMRGE